MKIRTTPRTPAIKNPDLSKKVREEHRQKKNHDKIILKMLGVKNHEEEKMKKITKKRKTKQNKKKRLKS